MIATSNFEKVFFRLVSKGKGTKKVKKNTKKIRKRLNKDSLVFQIFINILGNMHRLDIVIIAISFL